MPTRREFLVHAAAAVVSGSTFSEARSDDARISLVRREDTVLRLGGNGDNWHMTWGRDDRQYVSLCDGFGWPGMPGYDQQNSEFNSRLYAISGDPPHVAFEYLPDYPDLRQGVTPAGRTGNKCLYYSFATLAVDGCIYQYLSTLTPPNSYEQSGQVGAQRFIGAKLIYSPDNGRTWCNQDGSTPVVWEKWSDRSRKNMIFFDEPQHSFSLLTALQMGRDYGHNRDGYVYLYAPNGAHDGNMNELVMCRVPKGSLVDRSAYYFFGGLLPNGKARWTKDIHARDVVHTFPRGWVNNGINGHPYAWHPSVVYNAPLGLYLMANWGNGVSPEGHWFGKPSYLGFWTAKAPWGPWTQIHEETAWLPANDPNARAYQPQIAPKWISKDGRSFWLVWTDFQFGSPAASPDPAFNVVTKSRSWPHYSFNIQRVDLSVHQRRDKQEQAPLGMRFCCVSAAGRPLTPA